MHPFSFFVLFFFCLFSHIHIEAANPKDAFYAISSLQHHIHMLLSSANTDEETIDFSQEDVAGLWSIACTGRETYQDVIEAYLSYEQTLLHNSNSKEFQALCTHSSYLLEKAWACLLPRSERPLEILAKSTLKGIYVNFDDNAFLDDGMKKRIRAHLLPQKHPAKKCLDSLFKQSNPIQNAQAFNLAGFKKVAKHSSECIVAKHPCLDSYLVKLYLFDVLPDKQNLLSWQAFCTRCESAAGVRALIKKHKMHHFTVPDKWIYVLPPHILENALPGEHLHPILLVVENMDLAGHHKSIEAWRTKTTHRHLKELYCILSHGYGSTKLPQNVPYTAHHKFALIDTEYPKRAFDYAKVKRFITPEMQVYWDELVRKGQCPFH